VSPIAMASDDDDDTRETTPHWPGVEKAEAMARARIKDRSLKVIMVVGKVLVEMTKMTRYMIKWRVVEQRFCAVDEWKFKNIFRGICKLNR
jgi:hypothetical protein